MNKTKALHLASQLFPESVKMVVATDEMWEQPAYPEEEASITSALPKRKREFRAGRHCAALALAELDIRRFPLLNDEQRAPKWPDNIVGSLTHCEDFCCVVASNDPQIIALGIDAELIKPLPEETIPLICSEAELSQLLENNLKEEYWNTVIFSAKEAFYKAYFPLRRKYLDFLQASVEINSSQNSTNKNREGEFVIKLLEPPHPALRHQVSFAGRFIVGQSHILTAMTLYNDPLTNY